MRTIIKLKEVIKSLPHLLVDTFNKFIDDNAIKLGASLSYYTLFSLPPLLIIIISLGGIFFGEDAIRGQLVHQIEDLVGESSALFIQKTLSNIQISQKGNIAAIIGIAVLVFSASTVFAEIQSSINFIWGLRTKPNKGIIRFVMNRLVSFSMIASLGFILMVSLMLNSLLKLLSNRLFAFLDIEQINLVMLLNSSIVFLVICTLFTIIFKTLPDANIRFRDAFVGAVFTSVLFMLGKTLIGFYLERTEVGSFYGAAASVALLMTWVYYSALILYFGAEFTIVYTNKFGRKIIPNDYSMLIVTNEMELTPQQVEVKNEMEKTETNCD
ncbi:MAG TPA: YihY/virulence factor BrkB family protein [Chitinophagales bacterium]|nr:YihY/virulence factor BrkB family protein [Chitinophagales bacterium]